MTTTTTTRISPDTTIRISIDAKHDLNVAGFSTAEAESMDAAWTDALDAIATDLGLTDVRGFSTVYQSAHEADRHTKHVVTDDGETIEQLLWQAAHDAIRRQDDGTWVAMSPALADHERTALRRYIDAGRLCDYQTGEVIRHATPAERAESLAAAERDGGRGAIEVDGRTCYVED